MNEATRQIAKLLDCTVQEAAKVQEYMAVMLELNFSECTKAAFNKAARTAWKELFAA